jgi:signal transduction histidine kinase
MCTKLVIKFLSIALISVIVVFCPNYIGAQQRYSFERINSESGLPANTIKGIEFDEVNRFLWIATESGIVRYNGNSFQTFGDINNASRLNGRIASLDRRFDGTIFGRLLDESVFYINNNIPVIDSQKIVLNFYDSYLIYKYKLPKSFIENFNTIVGITYNDFIFKNSIYFFSGNTSNINLYQFQPNKELKKVRTFFNYEQNFIINDRLFLMQKDGKVFEAIKSGDSLFNYNKIETNLTLSNKKNILKIFKNSKNDIYLLDLNFLYSLQLNGNKIDFKLITDQVPTTEDIRYFKFDKLTQSIFLGTDNRGILIGHPSYFKRVLHNNMQDGISSASYAQVIMSNGNIQINSGQQFGNSKVKAPLIFYRPSATNTFTSSKGILYYSNYDGIIEYDLKANRVIKKSTEIKEGRNCFIEINDKIYSFSDKEIAVKGIDNKWKVLLYLKKIPIGFIVNNLSQFNEDEILVATTDGLYKYYISKNKFIRIFKDKSGAHFRAIYNLNGYFLLGTYGGGLYMLKGNLIKKMPFDQNKYLSYTHCFILDKQNRIWASTNKGLFMSPSKALTDFWDKGPGNISFKYFGKLDGIDVLELNGGCTPCVIQLPNGDFSFPGIDGLIQFNPNDIKNIIISPKIYLDKVLINNNIFPSNKLLEELSSKTKNIELQFGISGMLSQENIIFEYKIDNGSWNRVGVRSSDIFIGNPGFGSHNVSVRIRNTFDKKWITNVYYFNIGYPWFLYPGMYLVYFFTVIGLVLLYIRFKTIIYQRRQIILENEVFIKTASLNQINKFLEKRNQAKDQVIAIMNHDVLTPLKYLHITAKNTANQIQDLKVKQSIEQISKTSKELEYLTSNMLNWVKFDNIETLPKQQNFDLFKLTQDLIEFVSPFKLNEDIIIYNQIPEHTVILGWSDTLRVVLYNLIMNAIKSTSKGYIKIEFKQTDSTYSILISDTGEGMSESMIYYLTTGLGKDQIDLIPKYKKGNGIGFQIIRHLVKLMHVDLTIKSKEHIGTKVFLKFNNMNLVD